MNWLRLFLCLLLLGGGALSSCQNCEQQTCDCFSEFEDSIQLAYDLDSLQQGFRRAETREAYVVRFTQPGFTTPLDTVRENTGQNGPNFYHSGIVLNRLFAPRNGVYGPEGYNFAVVLPRAGRRYLITDIELAGETRGDKCCRCYSNTRKRLRLDGAYLVAEYPNQGPAGVLRR